MLSFKDYLRENAARPTSTSPSRRVIDLVQSIEDATDAGDKLSAIAQLLNLIGENWCDTLHYFAGLDGLCIMGGVTECDDSTERDSAGMVEARHFNGIR